MIRTALIGLLLAAPAAASTDLRDELVTKITGLGAHETATTRHAFELDGCDLTIFFWEDWNAHRLALHSVHHFDLTGYDPLADRPAKRQDGWFGLPGREGSYNEVLMIEMREHGFLVSELAKRSDPRPPYEMSTREDIDAFVKKRRLFHGLRFDGLDAPGRMANLAQAIEDYYHAFCKATG